jgi:DNA-binding PadR family transcriptional regulator
MTGARAYLGELEQLVLLAVLRLEGEGYGTTLRREIEECTGRDVAVGALYAALERLERKGFVRSRLGQPTARRGGRARRHYEVTVAGQRGLERSRRMLDAMWRGVATEGVGR